jgi:ABC-type branched-subunit amino acid transport system ATPase component/ABC-type branched-subunit amino acid transport system permease subunit
VSDHVTEANANAEAQPTPPSSGRALPKWRRLASDTLLGGPIALAIPIVLAILFIAFPYLDNDAYWIREFSLIAVLALVVSGVNLSFGYAGEIQFGQVFMFALGTYLTMILAGRLWDEIIPLLLIGGIAAALVGAVIAFPAVRIGGWSLALTSFFLVITIPDLVAIFQKYTGGLNGLVDIPNPNLAGHALTTNGLYEVAIIATIIWFTIYRNLVTSRYGVIFRILRHSPVLANSLGFSTRQLKLMAYTMGAFPAGMAGCLFGFISLVVTPDSFGLSLAIGIVAGSLLGGIESVYGVFIAAAVLQLGPESSLSFAQYAPVAYGAFLIIAATLFRNGLGGLGKKVALWLSRLLVGDADAGHATAAGSLSAHVTEDPSVEVAEIASERHGLALGHLEGRPLAVTSVSKSFGGNKAVDDVSLTAEPGRVTALIGSNGSGKTTVLNLICAYAKADAGSITFGESTLTGMRPHQIAHVGVGRTFQTPSVPRGVSVLDVVASGRFYLDGCGISASVLRLPRYWRSRRADRREALVLLELVGLARLADQEASSLSLGTRRLVEVARALCARPGVLLLDEPASGLSDEEVQRLGQVITAAARAGATVVLIEHNFGFVSSISEVAHVLDFGKLIASGSPSEVSKNPQVIESFLGQTPGKGDADAAERPDTAVDESLTSGQTFASESHLGALLTVGTNGTQTGPLLEVRDAESGYGDLQVLRGVSLVLEPGKLEVVLGRNGVGKTTLLGTITGQVRLWKGSVKLAGNELGRSTAYRRAAAGIALVQEGKRIFRERTIMENVMLGTFTQKLSRRERRELCEAVLENFPILSQRATEQAGGLSGGQQQMLAIAQALASRPKLLLLDEPSAGLAPAIVREVFQRIKQLSEQGMTIVLVEQLAEQALVIADHVTVIDNGRVVATGSPQDFHDQQGLQEAYFGDTPSASAAPVSATAPSELPS